MNWLSCQLSRHAPLEAINVMRGYKNNEPPPIGQRGKVEKLGESSVNVLDNPNFSLVLGGQGVRCEDPTVRDRGQHTSRIE